MFRWIAPLVALVTGVALLVLPAEARVTRTVGMSLQGYSPASLTVLQGQTVTWHSTDFFQHTSTSDQGFWKSPLISGEQTYSQTDAFLNAGTYPYHCTQHPLSGTVRVPLAFSGGAATGYTLKWSSASSTPTGRNFDVQIKKPGSNSWVAFKTRTTQLKTSFNPAADGTYQFRARTRNTANGKTSGWTATVKLAIT